jgi:phosphatidylglycerophosphatase A
VRPALVAATTLGLGRWPWAPATLTSAVVTIAVYAFGSPGPIALAGAGLVVALAGVPVAGAAERVLGRDAGAITIDETAGMLLTLAAAHHTPASYFLAFIFFRVFDVLKPPPLDALQRLPGGLGVVADDVAAAAYAALLLLLPRWLGLQLPWLAATS